MKVLDNPMHKKGNPKEEKLGESFENQVVSGQFLGTKPEVLNLR